MQRQTGRLEKLLALRYCCEPAAEVRFKVTLDAVATRRLLLEGFRAMLPCRGMVVQRRGCCRGTPLSCPC